MEDKSLITQTAEASQGGLS